MTKIQQAKKLNTISYILLIILACECVAGSSGRWFELGNISIRMVIFIITAFASIPLLLRNIRSLVKNTVIQSILIFFLFVCFSAVFGYIRGNDRGYIFSDVTSFLFMLIVPSYIVICNTQFKVEKLIRFSSIASLALAVVTIVFHFILLFLSREIEEEINYHINYMGLGGFFGFGDGIYRIYFKSSVCFILPFLYNLNLLIKNKKEGNKNSVWLYVFMSVSMTAIVLTYTRSVWFGVLTAIIVFVLLNRHHIKTIIRGVLFAIAGFLVFVAISWASYGFEGVVSNAINRALLGQEEKYEFEDMTEGKALQAWIQIESDDIRAERLQAVYTKIKDNWLLGSGLGQELNVRHYGGKIEYTYLDILSKMGIFGYISFLSVLLIPVVLVLRRKSRGGYTSLMGVLLSVMICIYMASIFNPFITSPIGLSIFSSMAASIYALKDEENKSIKD